jgi:hypothetical protein
MLISSISFAGDFKLIKTDDDKVYYEFSGDIAKGDNAKFENILDDLEVDEIDITINSPGGDFMTSLELSTLTMENDDRVNLIIDQAFSGAAHWAASDSGMKFKDNKSVIGFHLPVVDKDLFTTDNEFSKSSMMFYHMMTLWTEDLFTISKENHKILDKLEDKFWLRLFSVHTKYGPYGMLCTKKDGEIYILDMFNEKHDLSEIEE